MNPLLTVALALVGLNWPASVPVVHLAQPQSRHARWHIVKPPVPGPFIDVTSDRSGNLWLSTPAVSGFVRLDVHDRARVFSTPGFTPRYLAYNPGDDRVYATSANRPKAIGALTASGQLTIYLLPRNAAPIPASKPTVAAPNWLYYAGRAKFGFLTPPLFIRYPYPSGLTSNDHIATTADQYGDFWATECCLSGAASLLEFTVFYAQYEYVLPHPSCARPAGMTLGQDGNLYVPCSNPDGSAVMVAVAAVDGQMKTTRLPVHYEARVNTIATGPSASLQLLYLAPASSPALWSYHTTTGTLTSIPTPDGSVPTAVALTSRGICALAGAQLDFYSEP
jgi:sugar lactone lactonase YvrE